MKPADWQGAVGARWAQEWRRTDRSFAGLDPALLDAIVASVPDDARHILDLGCGAGTTGLAVAAARPSAVVTGLDLSSDLLNVAAHRAAEAGLGDRCRFLAGDAAALAAELPSIDAVVSRHGVMFFDDPAAAFLALATACAPGARLVFSCFAALADNPWATETIAGAPTPTIGPPAPGPFAFADQTRVAAILRDGGWDAATARRVDFRYVAGGGPDPVADAFDFLTRIGPAARALAGAGDEERPAMRRHLRTACAARSSEGAVAFPAAAWIWTARRGDVL